MTHAISTSDYQCLGANCGSPPSILLCGLTKCFSFLGALHFFKSYLISIHHVPSIRLFPPQYWTPLHSNNWDDSDELNYYSPQALWGIKRAYGVQVSPFHGFLQSMSSHSLSAFFA